MTLAAWLTRIHHGYIGLVLAVIGLIFMGVGLSMEINTWDAQGNYATQMLFQDVWGWVVMAFGLCLIFIGLGGLFVSDLLEHFIMKEKHSGEIDKIEDEK